MVTVPQISASAVGSKKRHIYESLLSKIQDRSLPQGTRLPNATILASEWQVAYATAHGALRDLTRDGWLVRNPKQGTFVSEPTFSNHRTDRSTAVLMMPPRDDISRSGRDSEVLEMLHGLTEGASVQNWALRVETLPSVVDEKDYNRAVMLSAGSAGIVFIGIQYEWIAKRLEKSGVPVVTLGNSAAVGDSIRYDRQKAISVAIRYFKRIGRSKVGYFGNTSSEDEKFKIFRATLRQEGLEYRSARSWHCPSIGVAAAESGAFLAKSTDGDAIFTPNYRIGATLLRKSREFGVKIPESLSLVALGVEESAMGEDLSYIKIPYLEYGREAMRLLAGKRNRPTSEPQTILLPTTFYPKASSQ